MSELGFWVVVLVARRHAFSFPLTCVEPPAPDSELRIPGGRGRTCTVRTVVHAAGQTGVVIATTDHDPPIPKPLETAA